jgi:2-C-methyl-D-erythritol 4-phosphate cytidylyltransferase
MNVPRYFALIPAAGIGARMAAGCPKQYAPLAGKPMLQHVLETFAAASQIEHTFVVVSPDDAYIDGLIASAALPRVSVLRCGGASRQLSVTHGLAAMAAVVDTDDWVLVHDAARPGLTVDLIDKLIAFVKDDAVGGLLAVPVVDTIKRSNGHGRSEFTVPRDALWAAQTPQMFRHGALSNAMQQALAVTDEASAIEAMGQHPKLVEGSVRNFKVTLPQDMLLAELYLKGQA